MVRAIVIGIGGRMGSTIARLILETPQIKLAGVTERPGHTSIGKPLKEILNSAPSEIIVRPDLREIVSHCDVVIDFTTPETTLINMAIAQEAKKAMVVGTTGFSAEQGERIKAISKDIACLISPNMSLGVNVLFKLAKEAALVLGDDYDVEITEAHHRFKQDAPSGTALKLGHIVAQALKRDLQEVGVYGRQGLVGPRTNKEIGIQAARAGDIVGDHTIMFGGLGERLELIHRAHGRENFARGALRAALWIVKQKAGLYDMQNLLGFT
ncbi:MAG: 4-hydroxy-tetrahydrodipicolinate reductase [Candidatus Tectomicrobia bacterium]|uniref:4-hydroxy-tetrahydrodipicolinate reductase n=1 Tax=Tectimicrobiota bacterium TaxID=2528274 RepID=A0A933GP67_UNCTE|nr:4-hydroxy-tetrahydrodipicolinate reductase [Candidatus Tectomicrobia bacterium]